MAPRRALEALRHEAQAIAHPLASSAARVPPDAAHLRAAERRAWRGDHPPATPTAILLMLRRNAQRLLASEGSYARLRLHRRRPGAEILRWREVSLAVPPSILLGAGFPDATPAIADVRILDRSLAPRSPVALLHAHAGATDRFEDLWWRLGAQFVLEPSRARARITAAPSDFTEGADATGRWAERLRCAFFVRWALSHHLHHRSNWSGCDDCARATLTERTISLFTQSKSGDWLEGASISSTLAAWIHERRNEVGLETDFLRDAFSVGLRDPEFARVFVEYLRVKRRLFAYLRPAGSGLRTFVAAYDRIAEYVGRDWGDRIAYVQEIQALEDTLDVRAVEVRFTPRAVVRGTPIPVPTNREIGVVAHFTRPRRLPSGGFLAVLDDIEVDERRIGQLLRQRPEVLRWFRALDVAGNEREGPLWLYAPTIRKLRETSRRVAERSGGRLSPLRATIHAGEDFDHLASGLRAVHEPLAWRLLERGDRLGHALALGLDVDGWARASAGVLMRPWERLLDLGWMEDARRRFGLPFNADWTVEVEREARELLLRLRARGWDEHAPDALCWARLLWRWLPSHDARAFRGAARGSVEGWFARFLAEPDIQHDVFSRDHRVDTRCDLRLLRELQHRLGTFVADSGLAIEVCPSSNLIVGGLGHVLEQPLFRMRPVSQRQRWTQAVAIASDDPLTFSTRLADEFAYAWAGLTVAARQPAHYAREWLEDAAANSMRVRFTVP